LEPIAVIGIGCRFPGAPNPEAFWQLLYNGVDAVTEVPSERWDINAFYDADPVAQGKMNTRWGGFLDQIAQFDPGFFGISPRETERMDPQQRLVLEVAWEALENAGLVPQDLAGSQTGVFLGISNSDYNRLIYRDLSTIEAYNATGTSLCIAANRLSYLLDLRGPSLAVDTACSSSLVAIHYACQSLEQQESHLCLVGGVSLIVSPEGTITFSQARMMAADGRCKTFDASADGYVRGEGCGIVVLKRLVDARRDQDQILAVIQGSAVNQDGLSNGLTAPNGPSQQAVIRQALNHAGVSPHQISYVEAHGTGTALGDPIEFKSLKSVLMPGRSLEQSCWLGSVKTNIGHLESAAGIAGFIKVVLALQHRQIPPHLHLTQLNPYIKLEDTSFSIPTELQPWTVAGGDRRLAGISSFGFGGTNCHVIVGEDSAPSEATEAAQPPVHLLTLRAKSDKALQEMAKKHAVFLAAHPEVSLGDLCFTANTARSLFAHRLAIAAATSEQLQESLAAFEIGDPVLGLARGTVQRPKHRKIVFLFTGQGSQYPGMGRQLYDTQPVFRQVLDRCDQLLRPYLEQSLLSILYPDSETDALLHQTQYTQPAIFALEYALAELWRSWGIRPAAVLGHSIGEYVAACVAGVFSLEEGLKLIAQRGALMQSLPGNGRMAAVMANEDQIIPVIAPYQGKVAIATINGPGNTVIAGLEPQVQEVLQSLQTRGIAAKPLTVSHAFHSPLMEPILDDFEKIAQTITYQAPQIPMVSNVTGTFFSSAENLVPEATYWRQHARQAVRFSDGLRTLKAEGYGIFLEVGPRPILSSIGQRCFADEALSWLPSLRPGQPDSTTLLTSLGNLFVKGVAVNWQAFYSAQSGRRIALPTYPFQRETYWISETVSSSLQSDSYRIVPGHSEGHPLLGNPLSLITLEADTRLFQARISADTPNFLKDHCVFDQTILPATAYVEMALAAGKSLFATDQLSLGNLSLRQALPLPAQTPVILQVLLKSITETTATCNIFSRLSTSEREGPDSPWIKHATVQIRRWEGGKFQR
jgi:acyl transferase domain-containing protein